MKHGSRQEQIVPFLPAESTPHIPDAALPLACFRCGAIDLPAIAKGTGTHRFRANCRHCGHWIKWLSTRTQAERHARNEHFYQKWLKKAQEAR